MSLRKVSVFFVLVLIVSAIWWFQWRSEGPRTESSSDRLTAPNLSNNNPDSQHEENKRPPSVVPGKIPATGLIAIPTRFQFPGVSTVQAGNTSKEWLAKYPASQQRVVQAFQKKFPGVYEVTSERQVAWMAGKGYLMPEDVIAASNMGTDDIKALADQGNMKAALLYSQRLQDQYNEAQASFVAAGGDIRKFADSAEGRPLFQALSTSNRVETVNADNPFVGYQIASQALSLPDPGSVASGVLRGLMQAEMAGDSRVASTLLDDYYRAGILSDAQVVAARSVYSGVLNYLGTIPPECRTRANMPTGP